MMSTNSSIYSAKPYHQTVSIRLFLPNQAFSIDNFIVQSSADFFVVLYDIGYHYHLSEPSL
ncbi:hypothetical protein yfred0001_19460 [Yersinia frederiksenii ATCC 33641]|nr:hypothetical protein yfred0001_19460 [Yersinia frederiksenii ATCC 33641]